MHRVTAVISSDNLYIVAILECLVEDKLGNIFLGIRRLVL